MPQEPESTDTELQIKNKKYWKENLKIIIPLLIVWFFVSFGCGIIWVDPLNNIRIGGYKLGFWFAQQGSIYTFVAIIFIYTHLMGKLDKKYASEMSSPRTSPPKLNEEQPPRPDTPSESPTEDIQNQQRED